MSNLSGLPLEPAEDDTGLAAARRAFLTAAPLFRAADQADSENTDRELFASLWDGETPRTGDEATDHDEPKERLTGTTAETAAGQGRGDRDRLLALVRTLAGTAGLGTRPALLDLFLGLRRHAGTRRLPPSLVRLALPLALRQTGLVPKAVPGLLAGRLPLGMTRASGDAEPVTSWLVRGLTALAEEATASGQRLLELTDQHRAWHVRLAGTGLRSHARLPLILDLLAATPVLSASLVARHLGCSPQGAGAMLRRLADLGIVTEATVRARWKIYLAGDLALPHQAPADQQQPLTFSKPAPAIDREALETTLDALFRDLERLEKQTRVALTEGDQGREVL